MEKEFGTLKEFVELINKQEDYPDGSGLDKAARGLAKVFVDNKDKNLDLVKKD